MKYTVKNNDLFFCSVTKDNVTCMTTSNCDIKCKSSKCNPNRIVNITLKKK